MVRGSEKISWSLPPYQILSFRKSTKGPNDTYLVGLVPEEVDLFELLILDVAQTIRLVPSVGVHVERDLTSDGVCQRVVREFLLQCFDEGLPYASFL